jgi:uncharacterized iron-regulated membrane protein
LAPRRSGHGRLARAFVNWITGAALFVLLSGIWLWWPGKQFGIGARRGRWLWYDLHVTTGIVAAVFMVLLAGSGIVMALGTTTLPMLHAPTTGPRPTAQSATTKRPHDATKAIPFDRAFAIGGQALPDAIPLSVFGPTPQGTYIVRARTRGYPDLGTRSVAIVDEYSGAVLYTEVPDRAPLRNRLWNLNQAIHFGVIFGVISRAIMALASLLIAFQVVSGSAMWIKRVPFRGMVPALVATAALMAIALYTILGPTGI